MQDNTLDKLLIHATVKDLISIFDLRYVSKKDNAGAQTAEKSVFISMKECSALTGYKLGYLRQLVFKRAIPFHKNPKLKPVRFKREEIIEWMATTKYTPIEELANNYLCR